MSDKKTPFTDGYQPKIEKGYQPSKTAGTSDTGHVQGGYKPASSEGGGPTNPPPNKK